MAHEFSIERSDLIVLVGDDENSWADVWAVFDVSETSSRRFIACHWNKNHPNEKIDPTGILMVFDGIKDLLYWCAYRQIDDEAEFRGGLDSKFNDLEWLEEECRNDGYESWEAFVEIVEKMQLKRKAEPVNDVLFTGVNEDEQIPYDNMKSCPSCGAISDGPKHVYCDVCGADFPMETNI
jgi:hypothetical protein